MTTSEGEETSLLDELGGSLSARLPVCDPAAVLELISMPERELQAEIVEPLLRRLGFRHVHDTSGSSERGKDLVAIKADEWEQSMLYAIQIKKFRPSAKVGSPSSFGRLLDQLRQAIQEPVLDPTTGQRRAPDWCLFVTPYAIPRRVWDAFQERVRDPVLKVVRIIDGPRLIDQIRKHLPEAFGRFTVETQYRLSIARETGTVREAKVAFELKGNLDLNSIYVELSLKQGDSRLTQLITRPARRRSHLNVSTLLEELIELCSFYTGRPGTPPSVSLRLEKPKPGKRGEPADKEPRVQALVDLDILVEPVRQRVRSYIDNASELSLPTTSVGRCTEIAVAGIQVQRDVRMLRELSLIRNHWRSLVREPRGSLKLPKLLPSWCILKIRTCFFVVGAPGSGKTTLLRRLCQLAALDAQSPLPLFLPLVSVTEPTYSGLIRGCIRELDAQGYRPSGKTMTHDTFVAQLKAGRFRLFFDGLDEAGSRAEETLRAIDELAARHDQLQVIVSCRDTFSGTQWDRALQVNLEPFTDTQLASFVGNWFSSEPTARDGLTNWLALNPQMNEAARTPLIAALLCSLFQVQADMPSTELELYEHRFELLLGKWDVAKGIQPMSPAIRRRYFHFLMALAFQLHHREKRFATDTEALSLAQRYFLPRFHVNPESLLRDCVRRGLLECLEDGGISFGHLTYQEYLAAAWLAERNPVGFVWDKILDPWWTKVIDFYATKKLDISPVVREASKHLGSQSSMERVLGLAQLAPFTSRAALLQLRRVPRSQALGNRTW